jgi:hypothetical protein
VDFNPANSLVGEPMNFYADNIQDQRGQHEANPQGFAKLALAQPEFGECLSRRVVDHVFHGTDSAADFRAVRDTFEDSHRLKRMLRTALIRYAMRAIEGTPVDPPVVATTSGPATQPEWDAVIPVPEQVRRIIDNRCTECHDEGDPIELHQETMTAQQIAKMAEFVGFGVMPKTAVGIPASERRAFVDAAVAAVFADPTERATARDFFLNGLAGHPVHRYRTSAASIAKRAGKKKNTSYIRVVETAVPQSRMTFSPTMSISAGIIALENCKKGGSSNLAGCVERATSPEAIVVGQL